jgi:hypothetical protein
MNSDQFTVMLEQLQDPAAPADVERVVMARIARLAESGHRPVVNVRQPERQRRMTSRLDAPAWAASIVGLVLFFASWIGGHLSAGALDRLLASPATSTFVLERMPTGSTAILGLTLGMGLFVGGLFARLRESSYR